MMRWGSNEQVVGLLHILCRVSSEVKSVKTPAHRFMRVRIINCYFHEILFWSVSIRLTTLDFIHKPSFVVSHIRNHNSFFYSSPRHRWCAWACSLRVARLLSNDFRLFYLLSMKFQLCCKNIFITNWCCPGVTVWLREHKIDFDASAALLAVVVYRSEYHEHLESSSSTRVTFPNHKNVTHQFIDSKIVL